MTDNVVWKKKYKEKFNRRIKGNTVIYVFFVVFMNVSLKVHGLQKFSNFERFKVKV